MGYLTEALEEIYEKGPVVIPFFTGGETEARSRPMTDPENLS